MNAADKLDELRVHTELLRGLAAEGSPLDNSTADTLALVNALRAVLDVLDATAQGYTETSERMSLQSIDRTIPRDDRPETDDVIRYAAYAGAVTSAARRARQAIESALGGAS